MCGIVGLYGDDNNYFTSKKREYILQGLFIDSLRGQDSTGMALLNKKGEPEVHKRAISGPDFVCTKAAQRLVGKIHESYGIIGHNRSMTRGNVVDENAHPFKYKHITLVHNGTVYNSANLLNIKCAADSDVDSAQVAWSFSEVEPDELLPIMQGPFSLVWWDSRDHSMHFARNDQKPMYWALALDKRTMYYASELEMVQLLVKRNEIAIAGDYWYTAPGKHYVFKNPSKLEEYDTRPFTQPKKITSKGGGTTSTGKQSTALTTTQDSKLPWVQGNSPKTNSNTSPVGTGDTTTTKELSKSTIGELTSDGAKSHPVKTENLTGSMVQAVVNGISNPNRQAETRKRCAEDGVDYKRITVAQPKVWRPHSDNQQKGFMLLEYYSKRANKVLVFQVLNCSMGNWMDKTRLGRCPVKIIGYREAFSRDENVYVVEIDEAVFDVMVQRANMRQDSSPITTVEIGMMRTQFVSVEEFNDLIKNGCINCSGHAEMDLNNRDRISWVGKEERDPICPACSENPQIMTAMLQEHENGTGTETKH